MSKLQLSVITCTRNPRREYFWRVLNALATQTLSMEFWEYVVVDNGSAPTVAERFDFSWHPIANVIAEPTLGLTPARLRGIRQTSGELLVFVDDDNVLDRDYLEEALRISQEMPFLGAWSGQCRGEFEQSPPEWTKRYWGNLVVREFVNDCWSNLPRLPSTMPCGAGLCVRRDVASAYLHLHESGGRRIQLDRIGTSLLSGGDNDLAACACDAGLGVGLVASLKLTHLIPPQRLTVDYHVRLAEGIHYSSVLLDAERGSITHPRTLIGRLADYLRLMKLAQPHREIAAAAYRGRNRAIRQLVR